MRAFHPESNLLGQVMLQVSVPHDLEKFFQVRSRVGVIQLQEAQGDIEGRFHVLISEGEMPGGKFVVHRGEEMYTLQVRGLN